MSEAGMAAGGATTAQDRATPIIATAVEVAVRLGVIVVLIGLCLLIISPFLSIVVWAAIIAVAADAPYEKLCTLLGGRRALAAALTVSLSLLVLFVPAVMLSGTLVAGAHYFAEDLEDGQLHLPAPAESVAQWPIVGLPVYDAWKSASENLAEALVKIAPQLQSLSLWLLRAAGSAGAGILQLVGSLLLAGVMLARSPGRRSAIALVASRLAGSVRGPELAELANATVQSVVQGILGVALIQSILAGLGFIVADIRAAGLWALLVLVAAVIQIPVTLVMVPPVLIAFSTMSGASATLFTLWCVAVSLLDNILKPILFGRGVKVPRIVIFLGAIGGILTMGIVGLFLGSVVLALGHTLCLAWLAKPEALTAATAVEGS